MIVKEISPTKQGKVRAEMLALPAGLEEGITVTPLIAEPVPPAVIDAVYEDLVDGASAEIDFTGGPRGERVFIVHGIKEVSDEKIIWEALTAPGIPQIGNDHPAVIGLPCTNVRAEPIDGFPQTCRVTATYGLEDPGGDGGVPDDEAMPSVEVSTTLQTVTVNKDIFGQDIALWILLPQDGGIAEVDEATGNPIYGIDGFPQVTPTTQWALDKQVASVEVQVPMATVTFRRRESVSPGLKALQYVGYVNSTVIWGDEPRTWLCTDLSGISQDGGLTYEVTYTFQRAADVTIPEAGSLLEDLIFVSKGPELKTLGWDVLARYTYKDGTLPDESEMFWGSRTSETNPRLKGSVGIYKVYPETNFRTIPGLPFGSAEFNGPRSPRSP